MMKENNKITYYNKMAMESKKRLSLIRTTPKSMLLIMTVFILMTTGCSDTKNNGSGFQIEPANTLNTSYVEESNNYQEKDNNSSGYLVKSNDEFYGKLQNIYQTILDGNLSEDLYTYFSDENLDVLYGSDAYPGHIRILFKYIANGDIFYPSVFEGRSSNENSTKNQELDNALNQYADKSLEECYNMIADEHNEQVLYDNIYNYFSYKGETILGVAAVKEPYRNHYYNTLEVYFRLIEKRNSIGLNPNDEYILGVLEICLNEMETLCDNYGYRIVITSLKDNVQTLK